MPKFYGRKNQTLRSTRYIPKKSVMNRLIEAWANSARNAEHRAIYNSLSPNEKKYVNNQGFGPVRNTRKNRALNPNSAAFIPTGRPLNANSAPFEPEANRRVAMANLKASGSKLPNWTGY